MDSIIIKKPSQGKKKEIIYKCPECKVKDSRFRSKTNDFVCRTCKCVWEVVPSVQDY
jgi:ribosomal protein L37AE/L43A